MKLYQIRPLLQDMGRNKAKLDKFSFSYANLRFEVIVLLEREPFELLGSTGDGVCSCCLHTSMVDNAHPLP